MARTRISRYGLLDADVEGIVRAQDLVYENAGTCWQDGHILGNGDLGAVAYAPYWLEWTINKVDVFDGRNAPKKRLTYKQVMAEAAKRGAKDLRFLEEIEKPDTSESPLEPLLKSCGQVKIRTASNEYSWGAAHPHRVRQTLCLWDATDYMDMRLPTDWRIREPSNPRVRSFVCRDRNVLVIRMRNLTEPLLVKKRIELCRPFDYDIADPEFGEDGDLIWFRQELPDGSSYAMVAGAVPAGSRHCRKRGLQPRIEAIERLGDRASVSVTGDVDLFVAVVTSYESDDPVASVKKLARRAMRDGADRIEKDHAKWWADFWRKSFVQFDDHPFFEQLWYFGLYQAASALGRAPVPGLFGLWHGHQDLPRQGFFWAVYTLDQNAQIHTLPVFAVNHPELALPFMDTFNNALPRTMAETRERFDLPGACYPLEMCFPGGEASFGSAYRLTLCGGPFCGIVYVWAYRYTRDVKLLRERIYPFLREVVRFFAAFMEKGDDGRYHLPPTVPAEIFTLSRDSIAELALLKPCLELAIEASRMFGVDAGERGGWEDVLAHYPSYPTKRGIIVDGLDIPLKHPSHHTYRLYPVVLAHESDPGVRDLVRKTLDHIAPHFDIGKDRLGPCGWGWFFYTRAKLIYGMKRDILPLLWEEIRRQLKPNGLFIHTSFPQEADANPRVREVAAATPENNSCVMMILTEMLLQSHGGVIRLFPGLPGKANARFGDLRAEGVALVSSEMVGGRVRFVGLTAERAGVVTVENPWQRKTVRVVGRDGKGTALRGKLLTFPMKRGESLTLVPQGLRPRACRVSARRPALPKRIEFSDGLVVRLGKEG